MWPRLLSSVWIRERKIGARAARKGDRFVYELVDFAARSAKRINRVYTIRSARSSYADGYLGTVEYPGEYQASTWAALKLLPPAGIIKIL